MPPKDNIKGLKKQLLGWENMYISPEKVLIYRIYK